MVGFAAAAGRLEFSLPLCYTLTLESAPRPRRDAVLPGSKPMSHSLLSPKEAHMCIPNKIAGYSADFIKAVEIGRPPNVVRLFPHSRALLVSGKVIDRAMIAKGKAMATAGAKK